MYFWLGIKFSNKIILISNIKETVHRQHCPPLKIYIHFVLKYKKIIQKFDTYIHHPDKIIFTKQLCHKIISSICYDSFDHISLVFPSL